MSLRDTWSKRMLLGEQKSLPIIPQSLNLCVR
jgi:hypothetical protein